MLRLVAFLILISAAPMAAAQSVQDQIVTQLQAQGFTRIEISRTILGRVQLKAYSSTLEREMVFNPTTGEILRDFWEPLDKGSRGSVRVVDPNRSSGSGGNRGNSGSGSRNDKDDSDNDRADRDNSGSGSSNSGRGNRDDDRRDRDDDDDDDDRRDRDRDDDDDKDDDDDRDDDKDDDRDDDKDDDDDD